MKYMLWISAYILLAACSHIPGNSDPVEWNTTQSTGQSSGQSNAQSRNPSNDGGAKVKMDHGHDFFVARKGIQDGYVFIFHIMPAPEGDGYSRKNYHLMVSVEKDGQVLTDLVLSSRVKHPDGMMDENNTMMLMGDWYMSLYNLNHEGGQHWITVSFERDSKTYSSGFYYPERAYHQ